MGRRGPELQKHTAVFLEVETGVVVPPLRGEGAGEGAGRRRRLHKSLGLDVDWRTSRATSQRGRDRAFQNNPPLLRIPMLEPRPGPAEADPRVASGDPVGLGF